MNTPWPPEAKIDPVQWINNDSLELVRVFQESSSREKALAFSAIYNRFSRSIWDYIYAQVNGAEAEAKDIFGQVWLVATEELSTFERRTNTQSADPLRSWLFSCASNRIKKYHREKNASVSLDLVENFLMARLNGEDVSSYELFVPEVKNKATAVVVAATSELKDDQKLVLWLRYNRNMTFAEIGAYLGKETNAVKVQHHRLIHKLRSMCADLFTNE